MIPPPTRNLLMRGLTALALVPLVASLGSYQSASAAGVERSPVAARATTESARPTSPPARICGSAGLRGPSDRPAGAKAVSPSQNLYNVVNASPAGTTFWLRPGTYRLNRDEYGQVIPKAGDTFIGAPGAVLDGQSINRYAFTGKARNVTISHLTIQHFGTKLDNNGEGVVNHDSARGWRVTHNTIRYNGGAGVFLGSHGVVKSNCLASNGEYGFQGLDSRRSSLVHNEITGNNTANWEQRRPGCGCTGGGKFWNARNVTVKDNWVHDNRGPGLWADTNNAGFLFEGNYIADNDGEGILYEISYNAHIVHNTFARNGWVAGPKNPGFPTGAIYVSESGSDPRVQTRYSRVFKIAGNRFVDNWSGVVGWENADRFAGSPNNSSTGFSTLVNPKVANLRTCVSGRIDSKPYFDDCRWKTKRLRVAHNSFVLDASKVPGCRASTGCGYQGLFSNWGTSPDWSPYQARVVERHITWSQRNTWAENSYHGPWRFMALDQATVVGLQRWKSHFHQDLGSSIS